MRVGGHVIRHVVETDHEVDHEVDHGAVLGAVPEAVGLGVVQVGPADQDLGAESRTMMNMLMKDLKN